MRPKPFHIRPIVDLDNPLRSAIFFRDQWVACSGVASSVATTTSSTCSAVIVGLRPDRGSSAKPSNRDSTNRDRHLPTVGMETPSCAATSLFVRPVAQASTIRERSARPCADFRRTAHRSSCLDSSDVNSRNAFGRPVMTQSYHTTTNLRRRTLAEARTAAGKIGATHRTLGLSDGEVSAADPAQRLLAVDLIREAKPDIVLTLSPLDYMPETSRWGACCSMPATSPRCHYLTSIHRCGSDGGRVLPG